MHNPNAQTPLTLPTDLAALSSILRERIDDGRRALVDIAVLVAHARHAFFSEDPAGWRTWGQQFGLDRRSCFRCLRAGTLLLEAVPDPKSARRALLQPNGLETAHAAALFACSVDKLEDLSHLPPNLLGPFLEQNNPAEMTREAVRTKIKAYLPHDAVDAADRRARPRPSEKRTPAPVANLIDRLAGVSDADIAAALETLDPLEAVRGARRLLDAAVQCLDEHNEWIPAQFEFAFRELASMDEARTRLSALKAQQEYMKHGTAHPSASAELAHTG